MRSCVNGRVLLYFRYSRRFSNCDGRENRGTMLKEEKEVRRNSQSLKEICFLGLIISERESKLKGS